MSRFPYEVRGFLQELPPSTRPIFRNWLNAVATEAKAWENLQSKFPLQNRMSRQELEELGATIAHQAIQSHGAANYAKISSAASLLTVTGTIGSLDHNKRLKDLLNFLDPTNLLDHTTLDPSFLSEMPEAFLAGCYVAFPFTLGAVLSVAMYRKNRPKIFDDSQTNRAFLRWVVKSQEVVGLYDEVQTAMEKLDLPEHDLNQIARRVYQSAVSVVGYGGEPPLPTPVVPNAPLVQGSPFVDFCVS